MKSTPMDIPMAQIAWMTVSSRCLDFREAVPMRRAESRAKMIAPTIGGRLGTLPVAER